MQGFHKQMILLLDWIFFSNELDVGNYGALKEPGEDGRQSKMATGIIAFDQE